MRVHALHDHRVADERPRLRADQDLTRLRRLFEPCGHVHRVTGREALLRPRHDLAGVDADPELERRPVLAQQGLVQRPQTVTQLGRRAHGAQRIVLVQDGDAEHRHHGIADELLHRPPVTFDDQPRRVEIPGHHAPAATPGRVVRRAPSIRSHHRTAASPSCAALPAARPRSGRRRRPHRNGLPADSHGRN